VIQPTDQQLAELAKYIDAQIAKLIPKWQAAVGVSQGPFGYLPTNAAQLGLVRAQIEMLQATKGSLADYRLAVSNWRLNDPQYVRLGLLRPGFPPMSPAIEDAMTELGGKTALAKEITDAAVAAGIPPEQTAALLKALGDKVA